MDLDVAKTLKVKTGALKRIIKDYEYAVKELEREEKRLVEITAKHSGEDGEAYRIRQQQTVVQESTKMVPEAKGRLIKAHQDLQDYVAREGLDKDELKEDQEIVAAVSALSDAGKYVS
eukprot:PhF_6_TR35557/c0_g1_i1/m.51792/K17292/TBCA; tubulin-specific chaperone A